MPTCYECCYPSTAARIIAFILVITDGTVVAASGWIAQGGIFQGLNFGQYSVHTIDKENLIFHAAVVTMIAAFLQMLISVFLFVSGGRKDRAPGCSSGLPRILILLVVSAALTCVIFYGLVDWEYDEKFIWSAVVVLNISSHVFSPFISACFTTQF